MTASNWGNVKGEAQSNKANFMKFPDGEFRFRIVGNALPKYEYWVRNAKGNSLPFENLQFDRATESFTNEPNPIRDLGIQHTDFKGALVLEKGQPIPAKSSRAYVCQVINRASGQVEVMSLKKSLMDGIMTAMQKLNDPKTTRRFAQEGYVVSDPSFVDFVATKSGAGLNTKYEVDVFEMVDNLQDADAFEKMIALHKADEAKLKDIKPIEEIFPRKTYEEQMEALQKHLAYGTEEKEEGNEPSDSEAEALNELD